MTIADNINSTSMSASIVSSKAKSNIQRRLEALQKVREENKKRNKNFFPSLIITLALWGFLAMIIFFVDPTQGGALEMFFGLLFLALLFTFSLLLVNTRRGFIVSLSATVFAILLYLGVGSLLNLLLIIGASVMFEIYFTKRK